MAKSDIPKQSVRSELDERSADTDPITLFRRWMEDALNADLPEPTAVTIATADREARPTARLVLLKGYDAEGFVFYTNYLSRKGRDLAENSAAAMVCYWAELRRQVTMCGSVARVSPKTSDSYFATRARASQLSAWASEQSTVIEGREVLERRMADFEEQYRGRDVPRPPHWGGYRLVPDTIEFWQGRENRLHDRLRYTRRSDGGWRIERLAP